MRLLTLYVVQLYLTVHSQLIHHHAVGAIDAAAILVITAAVYLRPCHVYGQLVKQSLFRQKIPEWG